MFAWELPSLLPRARRRALKSVRTEVVINPARRRAQRSRPAAVVGEW